MLANLPSAGQDQVEAWLHLTSGRHTSHMRAVAEYLGYTSEVSPSVRRDHLASMEDLARSGEPYAQGVVGYLAYQGGLSGRVSRADALQLMWSSVRSSSPFVHAYAPLGLAFVKGVDVAKDEAAGFALLKRGVEHGSGAAMFEVAQLLFEANSADGDLSESQRWASLAQVYGEPRADRLLRDIEHRQKLRSDEQAARVRQESARVARERDEQAARMQQESVRLARAREDQARRELERQASRQSSSRPSPLAEAFRGAANFLGELLQVGAVVGVTILAVATIGLAGECSVASAPPVYSIPAVEARRYEVVDRAALRPIGTPAYSSGQAVYSPSHIDASSIASIEAQRSRIVSVEIRDGSYDPTRTIRAQVDSDGKVRGRSVNGAQVRGFVNSSGGRTEIELRPGAGFDPTTAYRGTAYGDSSTINLKNPYTGSNVTGTISSTGGYRVR